MSPEILTILLFASLLVCLVLGLPIVFTMGGIGLIFGYYILGSGASYLLISTAWGQWNSPILMAIPLFVLMGNFLERSGIAEDLYQALYEWLGPIRGGLAMGTIVICAIFAAMAGVSAVGTITMGLIALPSMLKRKYSSLIAVGAVSAGGTLGILIPPSVPMIIYGSITGVSVGKLFMGGMVPGILMAALFVIYIGVRSFLQPEIGPAIPKEERIGFWEKIKRTKSLLPPFLLIAVVLGVIYLGVCTPTEAAAIGASGSVLCLIVNKRFTRRTFKESITKTLTLSAMVMWIVLGANIFAHVYAASGAADLAKEIISNLGFNKWLILIMTQIILLILGCFMDPVGIMVITCPVFVPIITELGFDPLWYGILLTINLEMGFVTPPFGFNLFYMKPLAEPFGINMQHIYKSVIPFILLEALCLLLIAIFPQLVLWLPAKM